VAVTFINDYTKHLKKDDESHIYDTNWIDCNPLLTKHFKEAYHSLLDSATKADPELGLDCNPIFDAQDYPDRGFSLSSYDSASGYVTVVATDRHEFAGGFPLVLKVVYQNSTWLVDGAGMINIPEDKRAKR